MDTEVEMKEIYASNHMWTMFEKSFLPDMNRVADQVAAVALLSGTGSSPITANVTRTKSHRQLVKYVCDALITVIGSFFGSPFSSTAAAAAAATAASSGSSQDHQFQTSTDDSSGISSSVSKTASTSAANTNATPVVQVSL